MVTPAMETRVLPSLPKACAKLLNCVMTINPPVDIIENIRNISQ